MTVSASLRRLARQAIGGLLAAALLNVPASYLGVAAEQAQQPPSPAVALSDSSALAAYRSEAAELARFLGGAATAAAQSPASAPLVLEDAWLTADPRRYNHGLAQACAVLAAVCNSESRYYSTPDGAAFAEGALEALGFTAVETGSYAMRSRVLDELAALATGQHNVVAYTLASKGIAGPDGEETVVLMGIRGSYGTEWLGNFDLGTEGDHRGFSQAEQEALGALERYVAAIGAEPSRTRVLLCGHSRGGAVANLLAAELDRASGLPGAIADRSKVYAYTFAAPACTRDAGREDGRYGNVFNVVDAEDAVPRWPFAAWGFGRYGTTVRLPSAASLDEATAAALASALQRNTGATVPVAASDHSLAALDELEQQAGQLFAGSPLPDPRALLGACGAILRLDLAAVVAAHLPDTYIAKLQCLEPGQLAFEP